MTIENKLEKAGYEIHSKDSNEIRLNRIGISEPCIGFRNDPKLVLAFLVFPPHFRKRQEALWQFKYYDKADFWKDFLKEPRVRNRKWELSAKGFTTKLPPEIITHFGRDVPQRCSIKVGDSTFSWFPRSAEEVKRFYALAKPLEVTHKGSVIPFSKKPKEIYAIISKEVADKCFHAISSFKKWK